MSDRYRQLSTLFHMNTSTNAKANLEHVALERLKSDSTFRTGIVTKIGELFIATPRELTVKLNDVLVHDCDVALLWNRLPQIMKRNYIDQAIGEEILSTNEIEGVRSTRKEVQLAVNAAQEYEDDEDPASKRPRRDPYRTIRFSEFAKLYLGLTDDQVELPHSLEDLRRIYDDVVGTEIEPKDVPDGRLFRAEGVDVIGNGGRVIHTGAHSEERIETLLRQMLELMRSDTVPTLLAAAAAHFLFEYMHPFYDGNGRTGRYLLALNLRSTLATPTILSLSRVIAHNRPQYYKAFTQVEDALNHGELTFFVMMLLDLIMQSQQDLIEYLTNLIGVVEELKRRCAQLTDEYALSSHASNVLFALMQEKEFGGWRSMTLDGAARHIGLSKQSARKVVGELDDAGLIEYTKRRPLMFRFSGDSLSPWEIPEI